MKRRKQNHKGKKPVRRSEPKNGQGGGRRPQQEDRRYQMDEKYKDTPMMTIEERKAAQLAKWRKELGLE